MPYVLGEWFAVVGLVLPRKRYPGSGAIFIHDSRHSAFTQPYCRDM